MVKKHDKKPGTRFFAKSLKNLCLELTVPAKPGIDSVAASGGILAGLEGDFTDLEGYFKAVNALGPAINNMMLVGHNTVRSLAMGMEQRAPNGAELEEMRGHVQKALEQGVCGFFSGWIYRPGRLSQTEEVIELARLAAPHDALYTTHLRNEGYKLLGAVEEALAIGREGGVHLHISHHKAAGPANWGKVGDSLKKVDEALASGQRVSLDVYPHTAGSGRMIEHHFNHSLTIWVHRDSNTVPKLFNFTEHQAFNLGIEHTTAPGDTGRTHYVGPGPGRTQGPRGRLPQISGEIVCNAKLASAESLFDDGRVELAHSRANSIARVTFAVTAVIRISIAQKV